MRYYKFTSTNGEIKIAAVPSEELLLWAKCLIFRESSTLPFDSIEDDALQSVESIAEAAKVVEIIEISQSEYRLKTGDSADSCHYAERPEYFRGELPENWEEVAMKELTSSCWIDQFGWNNDMCKVINGEIDSLDLMRDMWDFMFGIDPELYLEAWNRWLYGIALT